MEWKILLVSTKAQIFSVFGSLSYSVSAITPATESRFGSGTRTMIWKPGYDRNWRESRMISWVRQLSRWDWRVSGSDLISQPPMRNHNFLREQTEFIVIPKLSLLLSKGPCRAKLFWVIWKFKTLTWLLCFTNQVLQRRHVRWGVYWRKHLSKNSNFIANINFYFRASKNN